MGVGFAGGWFAHVRRAQQIETQLWAAARRPWPAPIRPTRPPLTAQEQPLEAPPSPTAPRQFRLDREHTGRSGYVLPHEPSIYREIRTQDRITAQPVVGGANNELVIFGSHDGSLHAANSRTGVELWRTITGDRIYPTALVTQEGTIYAGTDNDRFFSVDPARGALQWALATTDDADTAAGQAEDGSLRFTAGRVLYATERDLTVRWRISLPSKLYSSPVVLADGTTILGCQDDKLYCITPTGTVRWSYATGGDVDATPAVTNQVIYVGSDDGYVYAIDVSDGQLRWKTRVGGYVRAGVALGLDRRVVVGTFGPTPRIVALDRENGHEAWSVPVTGGPPTGDWGVLSAAMVDREGRYAVGTPLGQLWLIERNGQVTARVNVGSPIDSAPVLLRDGVIAVGTDSGTLFLLADIPRDSASVER